MTENRETMTLKGKTKVILAIIGMLTVATPGVLSLIGQGLDRGEEKADEAYRHLVSQVEFTDRQLIEIRKEIVVGDEKLREMIFELTLAIKTGVTEKPKEEKLKVSSKPASKPTVKPTMVALNDLFTRTSGAGVSGNLGDKGSPVKKQKEVTTKQMEQRPMLPDKLDALKIPLALKPSKKSK